ncbi:helicase-related protein [Streptomyces sp. NPDC093510]|uniref:helicase-related protein n=1 Tax=Streptomyces sp. NPDC093510 TaxID=3155199 RepID=UPI00343E7C44
MDLVPALEEPLKKVVGPATAKVMAEHLDLHTVGDLLHHYPRRYAERGELTRLAELPLDEHVTVVAQVASARILKFNGGRGQRLEVTITDGSGQVQLVFFGRGIHKPHKDLLPGTRAMFAGKVSVFNRKMQLAHPAYELLRAEGDEAGETVGSWAGALLPIYPATAKLESWKIAKSVDMVLPSAQEAVDPLPPALRDGRGLIPLPEALLKIHRPHSKADIAGARDRLKWDEAFVLQVALARRRYADAQLPAVARRPKPGGLLDAFDAKLPFTLTEGQEKVSKEIFDDLATEHPMHRLLQGEVGSGKAQPLDSLVLTPEGFRPMGDMNTGDLVVVPTGETAVVSGVFPQGERDVWRLTLSDGSSVECDDEHLWIVGTSCGWHRGQPPKVLTTREIRLDLCKANGSSKWYLPAAAPTDLGHDEPLPLDPYLFGLLLGDGSFRHDLRLSTADEEIHAAAADAVAPECRLDLCKANGSTYDYTIQLTHRTGGTRNPVIQVLRDLELWGVTSHGKFVPEIYKNTSIKNRLALLQGLLDTDGTIQSDGLSISLCSASLRLADDVAWLVRSLGGRARVLPTKAAFNVSIALPEEYMPFRLTRKAERVCTRPKYDTFRRGIRSVEFVGRKPVQCISVAHPSRAYITDNFTVTHNTMVALRAMLAVVDAGGQAAMLAPTEVLAQQHHRSIVEMMGELAEGGMLGGAEHATKVTLLTGSMGAAGRRQALLDLVTGEAGIVIGTHALIEDKVQFHDLGLVVVDEQHRFGVEQRDALRGKGKQPPHLLVMTATPIPRTVAMTVFGDLETSVLDQLPAGRSPIASHVVPAEEKPHFLARAWERVREEVENGHQAYVVCPRIGDDEAEDPKKAKKKAEEEATAEKRPPLAVLDVAEQLSHGPLRGLKVEVLHGRMQPDDKDAVMRRFTAGETQVLVATTVIEVGVNVPNATAMVIMDADRFGVSQLHQLRGRVGRGSAPGLCLLVTDMPEASPARARLGAVASTLDGFELSRIDLEQRREGDVLGQAQSGVRSSLRMLAVIEDEEIIAAAREEAVTVVAGDPELERLPELRTALDALLDAEREQYLDKG